MTKRQRGQVFKLADGTWAYRYRSRDGRRPQHGGYRRQGDAAAALREQLDRDQDGIRQPVKLQALIDQYLEAYSATPGTRERLEWNLSKLGWLARLPVDRISQHDVEQWRAALPEQQRYHCHAALRQVLNAGVRWKYLAHSPLEGLQNPAQRRPEIHPFTRSEIEAITAELAERDALLVRLLADTGLRPGEALALERRDLDLHARLVQVNRSWSRGRLSQLPKNGARRSVPLRAALVQALAAAGRRIDVRLLFPATRSGGYQDWHNWRARQWKDAIEASGVTYRQPYALRHTYATESIRAGVPLYVLARRMGTSLRMLEQTYAHLAEDTTLFELDLLDRYDAEMLDRRDEAEEC